MEFVCKCSEMQRRKFKLMLQKQTMAIIFFPIENVLRKSKSDFCKRHTLLHQWTWHCSHFVQVNAILGFRFAVFFFSMPWKIRRLHRVTDRRKALCVNAMTHDWGTVWLSIGVRTFRWWKYSWSAVVIECKYQYDATYSNIHCLRVALTPPQECICEERINRIQFKRNQALVYLFIDFIIRICFTHYEHECYSKSLFSMIRTNCRMQNKMRACFQLLWFRSKKNG